MHNPDVICVVETWLAEEINSSEISLANYQLFRLDRNRHGGGVLMYIRNNLVARVLLCGPHNLELLVVSISNSVNTFCIGTFYRPPGSLCTTMDYLCTSLASIDLSRFSNFVLIGDFNINYEDPHHPLYHQLQSVVQSFSLSQVVPDPTHTTASGTATLIDLALLSNPELLLKCDVIPPLSNSSQWGTDSDHCGVNLQLRWRCGGQHAKTFPRPIWRYAQADFPKACQLIDDFEWDSIFDESSVNESVKNWERKFLQIMDECIPKGILPKKRNLPWLTKNLVRAMRKRNFFFRRAKKSGLSTHFQQYRNMRNKTVTMMRNAKKSFFSSLCMADKKKFWKTMKLLRKDQSTIPFLSYNDMTAQDDSGKANMLNEFFSECFNSVLPPLSNQEKLSLRQPAEECPEELLFTESEVLHLLQTIDVSKATGPDNVSGRMLKATAANIAPSITKIFNQSIKTGEFPQTWKRSNVAPVPKSSNKSSPTHYRPISLLSILSKLLERHIYYLVASHLDEFHPISQSQWGFQSGKSTVTALLETTHNWFQLMEDGKEVGAVFFDFRKAFDSVPHRALMNKLEDLQLNRYILNWIQDYLTERRQRVVVNGSTSDELPVLSGVPQGSVIGPLLFLIYIDGLKDSPLSTGSKITLYADDILLYRPISCLPQDYEDLQNDIDTIASWVSLNYLSFNISKCKYMIVTRKRKSAPPLSLRLSGEPLERVDCYKYLGLLLSSDLSWNSHIHSICGKARKLLGLIYRRYYNYTDPSILLQMYLTLVRPHLEYASQVWSPHLSKDINMIEDVQKFALRMCGKLWDEQYEDLLHLFNLPTMAERRLYLDLCTMFKIVHGFFSFPPGVISEFRPCRKTRNNDRPLLFHRPYAHSNYFYHSFFLRSICSWNCLPPSLVSCTSLPRFKSQLVTCNN